MAPLFTGVTFLRKTAIWEDYGSLETQKKLRIDQEMAE